ncbi:hypothetical protein COH20_009843 [Aspergillus flavus]|nr:hypothetical protein NYO67_11957 [Aspergillus flavus]RAQ47976.1 hypothetical protein AFGD_004175 [Aspergillus flavus]RAQ67866.1 hypothetical protein COH20_009843 [Aspergillus flavus]RAQ79760.1 hypothetical protein COH21_003057 [Aspergillus flavus]
MSRELTLTDRRSDRHDDRHKFSPAEQTGQDIEKMLSVATHNRSKGCNLELRCQPRCAREDFNSALSWTVSTEISDRLLDV